MAAPSYWFAVKRYGWGWGMPVRWQGWLVLFGYLGLVYAGIYFIAPSRSARVLALYLFGLTVLLVVILAWKGERPLRWRWGEE
jgi:drug/metabolite transporter (DMT)-like permease